MSLSIVYSNCGHEYKKIFKEEKSVEALKILGLINNIKEYQKKYNHAEEKLIEVRLKKIKKKEQII